MRNGAHYTPHEARAALQYLDPGMPEDSWWRVAAASPHLISDKPQPPE